MTIKLSLRIDGKGWVCLDGSRNNQSSNMAKMAGILSFPSPSVAGEDAISLSNSKYKHGLELVKNISLPMVTMGNCSVIVHLAGNTNLCSLPDRLRYCCRCAGCPRRHNNYCSVTYPLPSLQEEVKRLSPFRGKKPKAKQLLDKF